MLLDDENKAGHILHSLHAAAAEVDAENLGTGNGLTGQVNHAPALLVLAVALDVQHSVESRLRDVDLNLDAISKTTDHHIGSWEIGAEVGVVAVKLRISRVASNALALGSVIHSVTERIHSTHLGQAGILAGLGVRVAETVIGALIVGSALWWLFRLAFATGSQAIAQLNGTSAATALVDNHSTLQGAHTVSAFVNSEALLLSARCTVFVDVQGCSRWTHTLSIHISHEALFDDAQRSLVALHGWVSGVSFKALANHGPYGQSISDATEGINSARLGGIAWIHTFSAQTGSLTGTIRIADADGHVSLRFAAVPSGHSSWRAGTLWSVLVHLAELVLGTDCSCCTRIITFTIDARPVRGTFVIRPTAQWSASNPGVSTVSWNTLAHRAMLNGQTLGVGSTLFSLAGRNAELITAHMRSRAVGVDAALDFGTLELWVSFKSLTTGADRLVILNTALGIQSTVARISADAVQAGLIRWTV